jgi:hypothetical protein
VASQLVNAAQVYNCLWSHAGGKPAHLRYVVQPVTQEQLSAYNCHGPHLRTAMFATGRAPEASEVAAVADRARYLFALNQQQETPRNDQ